MRLSPNSDVCLPVTTGGRVHGNVQTNCMSKDAAFTWLKNLIISMPHKLWSEDKPKWRPMRPKH